MTIPIYIITFLLIIINAGCTSDNNDISSEWTKTEHISDSELHAKQGDCITFKDSTGKYFIGMISTFNKSEGGIWYAICFANYYDTILPNEKTIDTLKLNARRVRYYSLKDYTIGLDITWARDTLIDKYKAAQLGQANIELEEMEITAEGSVSKYSEFLSSYNFARMQRLFPEKYDKDLIDSTFHASFYLGINDIKEALLANEKLQKSIR